ncbi:MAG: hypothetical protein COB89_02900 [Piscirickettsiaceae bacterium]|nr:MAG: hypothetical protein COB89_02900 [Piscirickettsiaceae bacterium]
MFKRPFNEHSSNTNGLKQITLTLKKNQLYLQAIQQELPKQLANHCIHVVFHNAKLIVYTDSPVWASKLLYSRVQIIDAITNNFREPVQGLTVRVVDNTMNTDKRRPITPSLHTINNLNLSNSSDNNDTLGSALTKLKKVLRDKAD